MNYCPVLDRFIEKNQGYVPLIDSGNPGTGLRAAVMPRVPPYVTHVAPQPLRLSGKPAKGCRMNAPQTYDAGVSHQIGRCSNAIECPQAMTRSSCPAPPAST
jgi:hypothetical protein